MAYEIEEYSLSELSRIGLPGRVIPALFWALPIGDWNGAQLEKCWQIFKGLHSKSRACKDYGVLLVKPSEHSAKGRSRGTEGVNEIRLDSKGADLTQLLPHLIDMPELNKKKSKILVMSGAYPQPGWAVCISSNCGPGEVADSLEEMIVGAVEKLRSDSGGRGVFESLGRSQRSFRNYSSILKSKPSCNPSLTQEAFDLKLLSKHIQRLSACLSGENRGLESALNTFAGSWNRIQTVCPQWSQETTRELLGPIGVVSGPERLRLQIAAGLIEGGCVDGTPAQKRLAKRV